MKVKAQIKKGMYVKWAGKFKPFMMIAVASSNIVGGQMTQEVENAIKYYSQKWALEDV